MSQAQVFPLLHKPGLSSLLEIMSLDTYPNKQPRHRDQLFQIFLLSSAAGILQVDAVEYPLVDNRIYFIAAGQMHTVLAERFHGWRIAFDPAFLDNETIGSDHLSIPMLFHNWKTQPFINLTPDIYPTFSSLTLLLRQEYGLENPCFQTLRSYLKAFLFNAERASTADTTASTETVQRSYMERLQSLLEKHYKTEHHIAFYAAQLWLSPKRLKGYAQQVFGKTVLQLLHEHILTESKRLLLYTSMTVKEVAYEIGFVESAYFSRFFKNKTGNYPEQFRQSGLKNP